MRLQVCLCVYVHRFHVRHNCKLHCRFSHPDWRHIHCILTDVNHLHHRVSHKEDDKHTLCNSCRPITASRHEILTGRHFLIDVWHTVYRNVLFSDSCLRAVIFSSLVTMVTCFLILLFVVISYCTASQSLIWYSNVGSCSKSNLDVMLSVNNNPDSGDSVRVLYSAMLSWIRAVSTVPDLLQPRPRWATTLFKKELLTGLD